jgi:hypothetical protein
MPCTTRYNGVSNAERANPWERTKIECDMQMHDEEGNLLGNINSNDDYSITATLLDRDGMTVMMQKSFFYIEKENDVATCTKSGWEPVRPVEGKTADQAIIEVAQEWLTEQYRTYVHSHGSPQNVYEVSNGFVSM